MSPVHIKKRETTNGEARYLVYYRGGGGREAKTLYAGSFRKKAEAAARRDLIAGELAAGRNPRVLLAQLKAPEQTKARLKAVWDKYINSRTDVGQKAEAQYRNSRDRWIPILGADRDPATVTTDDVIAGVAELYDDGEGLAPATISQYVSNLGLVLDFADVEPNPARSPKVKLPRATRTEKSIPSNETWFAIRGMIPKRSQLALALEEACALRVSEATGITWGDIDFPSGMVRVDLKTTAGRRWVPVPDELLKRIDALLPLEDRQAERKVLGIASNLVYDDLKRASKLSGSPRYGTHVLRHRRISLWLRHGIDPVQISRWSGHAKPSESLNTYGHVIVDPLGDEWREFWLETYERTTRRTPDRAVTEELPQ